MFVPKRFTFFRVTSYGIHILVAEKKDSKNGAPGKFFGPSYSL